MRKLSQGPALLSKSKSSGYVRVQSAAGVVYAHIVMKKAWQLGTTVVIPPFSAKLP